MSLTVPLPAHMHHAKPQITARVPGYLPAAQGTLLRIRLVFLLQGYHYNIIIYGKLMLACRNSILWFSRSRH